MVREKKKTICNEQPRNLPVINIRDSKSFVKKEKEEIEIEIEIKNKWRKRKKQIRVSHAKSQLTSHNITSHSSPKKISEDDAFTFIYVSEK